MLSDFYNIWPEYIEIISDTTGAHLTYLMLLHYLVKKLITGSEHFRRCFLQ